MRVVKLSILKKWMTQGYFDSHDFDGLFTETIAESFLASNFGITAENGLEKLKKRANLFLLVYQDVLSLCLVLGLNNLDKNLSNLWNFWLPISLQIAEKKESLNHTFIQGILGVQGTGKTTLTLILKLILGFLGQKTIAISLDDLYKTYNERQKLRRENPFLIWRGPPGTHDVNLGLDIFNKLREGDFSQSILVPRFDKSLYDGAGDRIAPELVEKPDICLFEGWFVGVIPVDNGVFDNPPWPIISSEDMILARFSNQSLQEYLPLWRQFDSLMVLYPDDYRWSKIWRKDAEHRMIASGKKGMSDGEIDNFVEYFWRSLHPELFITPLVKNRSLVDLAIAVGSDHSWKIIHQ